jgi:hypothetical protein
VRKVLTWICLSCVAAGWDARPANAQNASCSTAAFGTPRYYAADLDPRAIAAADFNEDGELDVATANFNPRGNSTLSVMFGNGAGGFGPPAVTPLALLGPKAMTTADVNGDGSADILVAGPSPDGDNHQLHVFLGTGLGSFGAPAVFIALPHSAEAVAFADVTNDGQLDAVFSSAESGVVVVLRGDGNGNFGQPVVSTLASALYNELVLADFDLDGRTDLAAMAPFGDGLLVAVFAGGGNGSFGAPFALVDATGPVSPSHLFSADVNNDGARDLLMAMIDLGVRAGVEVALNNGDGTFGAPAAFDTLTNAEFIIAGDLTGDGNLDLVASGPSFNVRGRVHLAVLAGDGLGGFGEPTLFPVLGESNPVPLIADLNSDGRADIVAGERLPSPEDDAGALVVLLSMCGNVADLAITMTDTPDPVLAGHRLTYTAQVVNQGPDAASVTVVVALPALTTFVSAETTMGVCWGPASPREQFVRCVIGDVPGAAPGNSAIVTVVAALQTGGSQSATSIARTSVLDPDHTNNTATTVTGVLVAGGRDLTIKAAAAGAASLTWTSGDQQAGYVIIRAAGSLVTRIPATGMLPANATSFVDATPVPAVLNCYRLSALNADQSVLATWTTVCLLPGSPPGPLSDFRLTVDRTFEAAVMQWSVVPGATGYILSFFRQSGSGEISWASRNVTFARHPLPEPTCYVLRAVSFNTTLATSALLCGVPGDVPP